VEGDAGPADGGVPGDAQVPVDEVADRLLAGGQRVDPHRGGGVGGQDGGRGRHADTNSSVCPALELLAGLAEDVHGALRGRGSGWQRREPADGCCCRHHRVVGQVVHH
jgi:hypothetical protein